MRTGALSDVVVLELATGVAGPYCGKLLADLGAQVVKVEAAGGDPIRREPPLVDGESAFFNWLNGNKLGVELALDDPRVAALAAKADIVVHSERGEAADRLDAALIRANPRAVIASLTPYGRSGERAGWETTEFIEYATGGYHYFGGDPAREPLALPGFQAAFHAGLHAAFGVLAGMWHARGTGEGQRIELSHQEATLSDHAWLTTTWTHMGQVQRRTGSSFVKCADGYVYLFNLAPYPNLFVLIERLDLLEDEELQAPLTWTARFGEVLEAFGAWAKDHTKQDIYHRAQELRIAISPVNTMADIAADPQLAAREWFTEVEVAGQRFKAPGFPFKLSATPCVLDRSGPGLGEHTAKVLAEGFAWANGAAPHPARSTGRGTAGPLDGVRLIEVTANWAGPAAGRDFADLGAEVIKIELQMKPATRALIYTGGDVWPDHYHRAGYFNKLNRNKKAICLDLSKPAGKQAFLDLVAKSDAVLENNAARVMGQLGLAYETLRQVNPRLVMCSMSGYGATGPDRNYSAYGSNIETASGLASILGYGPGEYFGTGTFYADPVTGNHGAVAMIAALHHARRTGEGQWIDMALLEAVIPFFAQTFLEYSVSGQVPEPRGSRSATLAPQGVYRAFGNDHWLAVSIRNERDFASLCRVIGRSDMAADPGLASAEGRRRRHDELDAAIADWAATRDHMAAADQLQAAGVPAAPVLENWELVSDNHLNDRGFFVPVRHPRAGTHVFPGFPWRFEKTPATIARHAPLFGEHNDEVFRQVLGMSDEAMQALYREGVTGDEPIYAAGPSL